MGVIGNGVSGQPVELEFRMWIWQHGTSWRVGRKQGSTGHRSCMQEVASRRTGPE